MNHHRRNSKPGVISVPCWVVDLTLAAVKPISSAKLYRSPIGGNRGEREAARAEIAGENPAALTNLHRRAVIPLPLTDAAPRDGLPMEAGGDTCTDPVPAESRDTLDAGSVSTVAVIEGLEKRGNEGVSLTGAMTLSAPAFAIR